MTEKAADEAGTNHKRLCGFFTVFGTGFDPIDKGAVLILKCVRNNGRHWTLAIPRAMIARGGKELAAYCEERGLWVSPGTPERTMFQAILSRMHGPEVSVAARTGWHGDSLCYVLPDGSVLGNETMRVYFADDRATQVHGRTGGDGQQWRDTVAELVPGNSRLFLALAAAVASPMLKFAPGVNPTIVNLYGDSSRGKSTVGFLYGSVWGGDPERPTLKFAHPWRQTANNAVALCAAHSGMGLVFDELKLCPNPGEIAYAVSLGEEKGRQNSDLQMREARRWQLIVFSTGEKTLDEAIEEHERRETTNSGTGVRCIDVPGVVSEHGVVEALNGLPTSGDIIDALNRLTVSHYGHAGRAFIQGLIDIVRKLDDDEAAAIENFKKKVGAAINRFIASLDLPDDVDPTVLRVARVFGLFSAAGRLACTTEVFPFERDEVQAGIGKCFHDWLAARGAVNRSTAQRQGILVLRDFLSSNPNAFADLESVERRTTLEEVVSRTRNFAGYTRIIGAQTFYMITAEAWKRITRTARRAEIFSQLDALGLLKRDKDGGASVVTKLPGGKTARLYFVDARIISLTDDCEMPAQTRAAVDVSAQQKPRRKAERL